MNNKVLTFIIGMLTGAILMTVIFIFVAPVGGRGNMPPEGMGNPPGQMGQPPEIPEGGMGMPPDGAPIQGPA